MLIVFNFAFLPVVHFQFNFRVDNKLQVGKGMGAQLCIWQEKHVVHIHLFDIIVLAGLCAAAIRVFWFWIFCPPPLLLLLSYKDMTGGLHPPSPRPQHPIKISVGTGAFVAVKSGKFRHKMSHYQRPTTCKRTLGGNMWKLVFFGRPLWRLPTLQLVYMLKSQQQGLE